MPSLGRCGPEVYSWVSSWISGPAHPLSRLPLYVAQTAQSYVVALPMTQTALHQQLKVMCPLDLAPFPLASVGETLPISASPASFSPKDHGDPSKP